MTDEQANRLLNGQAVAWTSPDVPDVSVDDDGTIVEHEDARPPLADS